MTNENRGKKELPTFFSVTKIEINDLLTLLLPSPIVVVEVDEDELTPAPLDLDFLTFCFLCLSSAERGRGG